MANTKLLTKDKTSAAATNELLGMVIEELRLLRSEVGFLFPQEDLAGYAHPRRIKQSYEKALKKYPPVSSVWR